ncbi:MAG: class II fructose-bisphosphate aldolase [Pseudomonadota bacterium]
MPVATLSNILATASKRNAYAIGLVCLAYEEAQAYVAVGEELDLPIILQTGPGARAHIPIAHWGQMFRDLAERAAIPVALHLDHGQSLQDCQAALDAGFSSVMYDGSRNPIKENVETSASVVEAAKAYDASVEVEVGHVGYQGDPRGDMTAPDDLALMARALPDAAIAISVGNVHLQESKDAVINWDQLAACRAAVKNPFVVHGGSGVSLPDRSRMAEEFGVRKINIGTELRQAAGQAMKIQLEQDFDKLKALKASANAARSVCLDLMKQAWQV